MLATMLARISAVVFTSSVKCHDALVALLDEEGFVACGFKGGDSATKRDDSIRTFQSSLKERSNAKPTVFVVTTKAGSVGVTLTAASRVRPPTRTTPRRPSIPFIFLLFFIF